MFFVDYIYIECAGGQQQEVRKADRTNNDATNQWLDNLRRTPSKEEAAARLESNRKRKSQSTSAATTRKAPVGTISEFRSLLMPLPENFVQGKTTNDVFSQSEYQLKGDNQVLLQFFYRGQRMSEPAAKAFLNLLNSNKAGDNVKDLQKAPLSEVLMDRGDPAKFKIAAAKIEQLDGKKALMVEGTYLKEPWQSRTYYVAAEDSRRPGSVVQEINYLANKAKYEKHRPQVLRSLKAIDWK